MGKFKHFLLIGFLLTSIVAIPALAEDEEGVIPESDSPGTFIPPVTTGSPTPPVLIDESDSSGVSDTEDYED